MYSTLSEQLDHATDVELPELQARILDLVQQADADMQRAPTFDEAALSTAIVEREDVKACVSTLNELVNGESPTCFRCLLHHLIVSQR